MTAAFPASICAFQPYSRGQRCLEQLERFHDDDLNVHRFAIAKAAAAESENALDQHLCALGRVHDVVQIAAQGALFRRLLQGELAVAQDGAEDVVEVVGDAAGQRADRLHLLRLPQLRFERSLSICACFCAVTSMAEPTKRSGLPVASRTHRPRASNQCQFAVGMTDAIFALEARRASFEMILELPPRSGARRRGE